MYVRRLLTIVFLSIGLAPGCSADPEPTSPDTDIDGGNASDGRDTPDSTTVQRVCDPVSPECGGQNWQFESDPSCPEQLPESGTTCDNPRTACYFCDDPEAAASGPGHDFTVKACAPDGTWELQSLTCAEG